MGLEQLRQLPRTTRETPVAPLLMLLLLEVRETTWRSTTAARALLLMLGLVLLRAPTELRQHMQRPGQLAPSIRFSAPSLRLGVQLQQQPRVGDLDLLPIHRYWLLQHLRLPLRQQRCRRQLLCFRVSIHSSQEQQLALQWLLLPLLPLRLLVLLCSLE